MKTCYAVVAPMVNCYLCPLQEDHMLADPELPRKWLGGVRVNMCCLLLAKVLQEWDKFRLLVELELARTEQELAGLQAEMKWNIIQKLGVT